MSADTARDQAIAQCASVAEMVAALECDYGRLEELREERDSFTGPGNVAGWMAENHDEAAELADLELAAGECSSEEEARERILEDALSVEVRSDWHSLGETLEPAEFRIGLCTGGPHVEFVGDLGRHGEPESVRCLYRDWGTSDELFDFNHDAALTYCRQFYFGE